MKSIMGPNIKAVYTVLAPNSLPMSRNESTSSIALIINIIVPTDTKGSNLASTKDKPVIEPIMGQS